MNRVTNKCLDKLKKGKKLTEKQEEAILEKAYKIASSQNKGKFNIEEAMNNPEVLKEAADLIIAEKKHEAIVNAIDLKVKKDIMKGYHETLKMHPGRPDLAGAAFFANFDGFRKTSVIGIETKTSGYKKVYYSQNAELSKLESEGYFNTPENQLALLKEVLEGSSTGKTNLTKVGENINKTFDDIANALISRGAKLKKRDKYMPQVHDSIKVMSKKEEEYINDTINLLDWEQMKDPDGNPIPPEKREAVLADVRRTIGTAGLNKLQKPKVKGNKVEGIKSSQKASLRNKYAEERFLIFIDAEAQFAYHQKYGKGTVVDLITNHINSAANDIAVLDVLGPKTTSSIDLIKTMMKINNAQPRDLTLIDKLHKEVVNDARSIADPFTASFFAAMRILGILPNIGSVMISALADLGNSAVAAGKYGFQRKFGGSNRIFTRPTELAKQIKRQITDKEEMVRLYGNVDYLLYQNQKYDRMGNDIEASDLSQYAPSKATRVAGTVADKLTMFSNYLYKKSGLTDWTEAGKNIAIREAMDNMADVKNKTFNDLDPQLKKSLQIAGINEELFNSFKKADTENINGVETYTIESIFNTQGLKQREKEDIFMALNAFGESYARESVPEAGAYIRAKTSSSSDAGDLGSEVIKTIMQFKRFPITYFHNQIRGDWNAFKGDTAGWVKQTLMRTALGAGLGIMAVQLSELANGRTTKEIGWQLLGEGVLKAGGAGIANDILFTDFSGRNRDFLDYAAGPTGSYFTSILSGKSKITNTVKEALGYEIEDYQQSYDLSGATAIDVLDSVLDYGNLWYTKEIMDMAVDQLLRKNFDDDYKKKVRKEEKKLKEEGQRKWSNDIFD